MNFEKLIAALKCSSRAHTECDENCPYRTIEKVRDDFPIPADVVVDGVGYWVGCDCDRMASDAADVIAKLSAEREEWIKFAEAMEKRVDDAKRQRDEMEELMMKYRDAATTIDSVPVRHGHWIAVYDFMHGVKYRLTNIHECSCCHEQYEFIVTAHNYCPNCGAKMMDEVS